MVRDKSTVMLVSASAAMRRFLVQALAEASDIEVIGEAGDTQPALEKMRARWPDVVIVDGEMPNTDLPTFVRHIMLSHPTPVIVCAADTSAQAPLARAVLAAGAAALVTRPRTGFDGTLEGSSSDLINSVRRATRIRPRGRNAELRPVAAKLSADAILSAAPTDAPAGGGEGIVAIGTSTGGTQALEAVLTRLPADCHGIVIVQHMPAVFTAMFAERLHAIAQIEVREARGGERVLPGMALVAPGGKHMLLKRSGTHYLVEVIDGPLVNRHRPSVDVLFRSVARHAGANALGIIMTGMGDDGALGLKEMHDAGARTIAQDEASCVVFGMPNEAIKLGAVDTTLPLDRIADAIVNYCQGKP